MRMTRYAVVRPLPARRLLAPYNRITIRLVRLHPYRARTRLRLSNFSFIRLHFDAPRASAEGARPC